MVYPFTVASFWNNGIPIMPRASKQAAYSVSVFLLRFFLCSWALSTPESDCSTYRDNNHWNMAPYRGHIPGPKPGPYLPQRIRRRHQVTKHHRNQRWRSRTRHHRTHILGAGQFVDLNPWMEVIGLRDTFKTYFIEMYTPATFLSGRL